MSDVGARISAWEAAGLIDRLTADRLRAAESLPAAEAPAAAPAALAAAEAPAAADLGTATIGAGASAAAWFGPGVTIAEVFGYLGAGFLLAAWSAFVVRFAGDNSYGDDQGVVLAAGALLAAVALEALGAWLRTGDARRSRAAGVAFVVALGFTAGAVVTLAGVRHVEWPLAGVVAAVATSAVALVLRVLHPSVLTQVGLLGALTSLAGATLAWAESLVVPPLSFEGETGVPSQGGPDPVLLVVATAAWWLVVAVVFGLIGLRESRVAEQGDPAAERRASISRFWAGLVAVIGLGSAVTRTGYDARGEFGRAVDPWVGDLALLVLSAVLVQRAFRRDTTAYVYPAALGLILALTDINVSSLSGGTEVALLVEGLILLGVGFAADRLRRRIGAPPRRGDGAPTGLPIEDAAAPSPAPPEPTASDALGDETPA